MLNRELSFVSDPVNGYESEGNGGRRALRRRSQIRSYMIVLILRPKFTRQSLTKGSTGFSWINITADRRDHCIHRH